MAIIRRKQIGGLRKYKAFADWKEGDSIQGKYVGRTTKADNYGKRGYDIDISYSSFKEFKQGDKVSLNNNGSLEEKFDSIEDGALVEVIYTGKTTLGEKHKFKGKECHTFEVYELGEAEDGEDAEMNFDPSEDV